MRKDFVPDDDKRELCKFCTKAARVSDGRVLNLVCVRESRRLGELIIFQEDKIATKCEFYKRRAGKDGIQRMTVMDVFSRPEKKLGEFDKRKCDSCGIFLTVNGEGCKCIRC